MTLGSAGVKGEKGRGWGRGREGEGASRGVQGERGKGREEGRWWEGGEGEVRRGRGEEREGRMHIGERKYGEGTVNVGEETIRAKGEYTTGDEYTERGKWTPGRGKKGQMSRGKGRIIGRKWREDDMNHLRLRGD